MAPTRPSKWIRQASADDIKAMARALAASPHGLEALTELLAHADAVGTYYCRADVEGGVAERLGAIEEYLGRPVSEPEFHTLVDNAWANFTSGGVPDTAYDAFCENLYGAIWDQAALLSNADAHPAAVVDRPGLDPTRWETVLAPTPAPEPAAAAVTRSLAIE